jgi:hypothetical protein
LFKSRIENEIERELLMSLEQLKQVAEFFTCTIYTVVLNC